MKIFELFGEVFLKDKEALNGLQNIDRRAASTGKNLGGLGQQALAAGKTIVKGFTVAVGAITAVSAVVGKVVNDFVQFGSEMVDLSTKTGISMKQLQELRYVAGQTGVSFDTVTTSVARLVKNMGEANNGSKTAKDAFERLGVSIYNANGGLKSTNDMLPETLRALSNMANETERNALAMELFGRGAQELVPLMQDGENSVDALTKKFNDLGLAINDIDLEAADKLGDDMATLGEITRVLWANIAMELTPAVQELIELLIDRLPRIQQLMRGVGDILGGIADAVRWLKGDFSELGIAMQVQEQMIEKAQKEANFVIDIYKSKQKAQREYLSATIRDINETYQKEIDAASDKEKALKDKISDRMDAERKAHDKRMKMIDDEYNAAVKSFDAETDARIKALQEQLDALEDAEKEDEINDLKRKISLTRNFTRRAEYIQQLAELEKEKKKEDLRNQIQTIQQEAQDKKEAMRDDFENKKETENDKYDATVEGLQNQSKALDGYAEKYSKQLEKERDAKIVTEQAKVDAVIKSLDAEIKANEKALQRRIGMLQQMNGEEIRLIKLKENQKRQAEIKAQLLNPMLIFDPKARQKLLNELQTLQESEKTLKIPTSNKFIPDTGGGGGGGGGGFALGTNYVPRAGSYMVGERGPEMVNLPQGSSVTPNNKLQQPVININIENPYIMDDYGVTKLIDRIVGRLKHLGLNPQ